ncbi:MAG: DUF3971 domain-containing protein, partial [Maricaulaceae bacterium]
MKRVSRATRIFILHIIEALGLVLVGAAIVSALGLWRLSQGPISLDFMSTEFEEALVIALGGDEVEIGRVEATWQADDRTIGVALSDIEVAERGGALITESPQLSANLSLSALLRGRVAFARLVVEGGAMSIVRRENGAINAGLGGPDQVVARSQDASGAVGAPPSLVALREALDTGGFAAELRELRLEGATLYVRDAASGLDWTAQNASLRIARDAGGVRAEASGVIGEGSGASRLQLSARAGPGLRQALFEGVIDNASSAELFPSDGPFAVLTSIDAPARVAASAAVDESRGLLAADVELTFSEGRVRHPLREFDLSGAHVYFAFDPISGAVSIERGQISSEFVNGAFRGRVEGAAAWMWGGGRDGSYPVAAVFEAVEVDARPVFETPLDIRLVNFEGAIDPSRKSLSIDSIEVGMSDVVGRFAGRVRLEQVSDGRLLPSVRLLGPVDGEASVEDVLRYWPVSLGDGARRWVERAVGAGQARNIFLDIDLPAEAIVEQQLENEKLALSFDFEGAEVHFVSTMSPLTAGRGSGLLEGNRFTIDLAGGYMAGMSFQSGFVDIPRLNPKGAPARFGGTVLGRAEDLLAFIDEPPLNFPSSYGIAPSSVGGDGEAAFEIVRPMYEDVPVEDIGFTLEGAFEGVSSATMFPGLDVTDADIEVVASRDEVRAFGEGRLGPAPARIEWRELLGVEGDSTAFHVEAALDASAFDAFGLPVRSVFSGAAEVEMTSRGRGMEIRSAEVVADLEQARLSWPGTSWRKLAGEPASAHLAVTQGEGGDLELSDIALEAPGAHVAGEISLASDGRLESFVVERLEIEDIVDAAGSLTRGDDGALIASLSGGFVDARGLVSQFSRGGDAGVGAPLDMVVRFDRVRAADGVVLRDVRLSAQHTGDRLRSLSFEAEGDGGPLMARVSPAPDDQPRALEFAAADAGEAVAIIFGVNMVRGGSLSAEGTLPPLAGSKEA